MSGSKLSKGCQVEHISSGALKALHYDVLHHLCDDKLNYFLRLPLMTPTIDVGLPQKLERTRQKYISFGCEKPRKVLQILIHQLLTMQSLWSKEYYNNWIWSGVSTTRVQYVVRMGLSKVPDLIVGRGLGISVADDEVIKRLNGLVKNLDKTKESLGAARKRRL